MTLCSYGHDEVCYEGRSCPACEMKDERDDKAKALDTMQSERDDLDEQLADSDANIRELETKNGELRSKLEEKDNDPKG